MDIINPLLPAWYDIVISIIAVASALLWIGAFITLWRTRTRLTPGELIVWTAVIVIFSALGSLAWLFNLATTKRLRATAS
jgi:hypothetical protein